MVEYSSITAQTFHIDLNEVDAAEFHVHQSDVEQRTVEVLHCVSQDILVDILVRQQNRTWKAKLTLSQSHRKLKSRAVERTKLLEQASLITDV